ncbi:hypothetical protein B0H16DRAFT_455114 [Mycena metata]|uniref:Uncharacterized protein n=1 Tax=Mycena metata TaxID=1033252 RepID=A0AAD7JHV5_9AGAR|nr:hypothetical protein B0H16DRAFT_455114 [Mycena metata]
MWSPSSPAVIQLHRVPNRWILNLRGSVVFVLAQRAALAFGSSSPSARPYCVGPGNAALSSLSLRILARIQAGTAPENNIPPRVLNAIERVRVTHINMSSISLSIVLYGPCGLQQVQPVSPSGPPCFALAVAPPLPVPFLPYLFIILLPTCSTPQSRPIDHSSSPTPFPSNTPPPCHRPSRTEHVLSSSRFTSCSA